MAQCCASAWRRRASDRKSDLRVEGWQAETQLQGTVCACANLRTGIYEPNILLAHAEKLHGDAVKPLEPGRTLRSTKGNQSKLMGFGFLGEASCLLWFTDLTNPCRTPASLAGGFSTIGSRLKPGLRCSFRWRGN